MRRAPASGRVRRVAQSRALGFDLGEAAADKLRPEAEAQALVEDAASLLFAQDALRGPAAQAYLALLQQISLKASPTRLFTAYGAFFRAQQATGARTFADHVVDEVIAGKGNPLAETCARGAREPSALELAAVRADMDLLQRLCVSEATVLGWCERLAESATPRRKQPASWLAAAEALGAASSSAAASDGGSPRAAAEDETAVLSDDADVDAVWAAFKSATRRDTLAAPPRPSTRAALREAIAESWAWSDALPALARHWALHGVGEVGARSVLQWTGPKTKLQGFLWGRGRHRRRAHRAVRRRRRRGHAPRAGRRGHGVDGVRGRLRVEAGRGGGARGDRRGAGERLPAPRAGARPARGGQAFRGAVRHRRGVRARRAVRAPGPRRLARAPRDPRRGRRAPPRVVRALPGDAAVPDAVRGVPQRADLRRWTAGGGGRGPRTRRWWPPRSRRPGSSRGSGTKARRSRGGSGASSRWTRRSDGRRRSDGGSRVSLP
jgi:hypothetical protein